MCSSRPRGRASRGTEADFTESSVKEGTLIVDVITPDESYVIWRGIGMAEMANPDLYQSEEEKQQRVEYVIYQILEDFPPDID